MQKVMSGVAMPNTRSWRPLCAALAYLMTRNEAFAEEVERDEGANQNIELDLQIRRAMGQETSEGPSTAHDAWSLLRGYISDGKVKARGIAVDRRGNGPTFVHTTQRPDDLPPPEAEHLVLCDGVEDETWLRCEEAPFGQGRYWKSVNVSWTDLMKFFPADGTVAPLIAAKFDADPRAAGRCATQQDAIRTALFEMFEGGIVPPGMSVKERNKKIGDLIEKQGGRRPGDRTFRRVFASGKR